MVHDATGRGGTGSQYVTVQNTVRAAITAPAAGATVSGTTWVTIWIENGTGASNTFTLSVNGVRIGTQTTSGRLVTLPWDTTKTPNGPRTLVAEARDATNNGGQMTRTVTVQNAVAPPAAAFTTPAAGATVSGTVSVGLQAAGGTPPYTYRLAIDNVPVFASTTSSTTVTYAWNTTSVVDGGHLLALTISDARNNATSVTRIVNTNTTGGGGGGGGGGPAPLVASFTTPAAGATVSGTVTVGMAASGGTPPYTYRLVVDASEVFATSTSATSASHAWDTRTVADGSRALGLTVTDAAGASAPAARTVTVHNSAPSGTLRVHLTQPSSGSTVRGISWAVIWVDGATGASNVYTLSVATRTVGTQTTSSTGPVSIPWDTTTVANGPQSLAASVRDASGNTGTTSVTITVQNGAVALGAALTSPAAGATVSGTVTVGMAASGGSPAYHYRLTIDGAEAFTTTSSSTSASYAWNTATAPGGSHTLALTVTDSTGASATASRTVTVDNTASGGTFGVYITQPTSGQTVRGTQWVTIWHDSTAPGARAFTLTVNGATVWSESASGNPVSLPWVTTGTPNGQQRLVVTVRDSAGATGTGSVTVVVQNP
jgi:hypothetical protein